MSEEKIKQIIFKSLEKLILKDNLIIVKKIKEECINHRFAIYLEDKLEEFLSEQNIRELISVDLEYNKNYNNPKKLLIDGNENSKAIRPDIIVHQRDTNDNNLIVIEAKKGYPNKNDIFKIKGLLNSPYNYNLGFLVSYLPEKDYLNVKIVKKIRQFHFFDFYRINKAQNDGDIRIILKRQNIEI